MERICRERGFQFYSFPTLPFLHLIDDLPSSFYFYLSSTFSVSFPIRLFASYFFFMQKSLLPFTESVCRRQVNVRRRFLDDEFCESVDLIS
jgi:hypothetical protein